MQALIIIPAEPPAFNLEKLVARQFDDYAYKVLRAGTVVRNEYYKVANAIVEMARDAEGPVFLGCFGPRALLCLCSAKLLRVRSEIYLLELIIDEQRLRVLNCP
jgi:hypothetical protein